MSIVSSVAGIVSTKATPSTMQPQPIKRRRLGMRASMRLAMTVTTSQTTRPATIIVLESAKAVLCSPGLKAMKIGSSTP
ncbi:hypothetical protein D3C77_778200 [compost metagenome]